MLAFPLVALLVLGAPGPHPDGGARALENGSAIVLDANASAVLSVRGLQRFTSSSTSVSVSQAGPDALALHAEDLGGTQIDAWVDGGAHVQARVFVHVPKDQPDLGFDFLPLTHSDHLQVRSLSDRITVIRARMNSVEDAVALEILAESHPRVLVLASLRASRVAQAVEALNAGMPAGLRAVWAGDRVVLRGRAEPDAMLAAEARANTQLGLLGNAVHEGRVFLESDAELDLPRMSLGVGLQKVFPLHGVYRAGVGDPAIADVKLIGHEQVLVVGVAEGSTLVEAWARDGSVQRYRVTVEKSGGCDLIITTLNALVPLHGEFHLEMIGDRIFVAGRLSTVEQALATADLLRVFPNVALLDPPRDDVLEAQARAVNAQLVRSGVSSLHAVRAGLKLWFDGQPRDPTDLAIAQGWADALFEPFARLPRKVGPPTVWPSQLP